MLETVRSGATANNPDFKERPSSGQENMRWFAQALEERPEGTSSVVLVGGRATTDVRLRLAQADAREDLLPSDWSHAFVLEDGTVKSGARIYEIPLNEGSTMGFPPNDNAVVENTLDQYANPQKYPNLAVLFIPASRDDLLGAIARFKALRSQLDAVELKARWLPYLWGVGSGANPLHEGFGIPSASFVEALAAANGYELTPGLASRSSCPEAIWQAARWWHNYHHDADTIAIRGSFSHAHHLA